MGQLYRATDTNLKRQVAIKVLPAAVADDGDRLARFQREAEVLAALSHPNIAATWRADGKELYFLAPDATLMAVPVTAVGTSFEAGTPVAL